MAHFLSSHLSSLGELLRPKHSERVCLIGRRQLGNQTPLYFGVKLIVDLSDKTCMFTLTDDEEFLYQEMYYGNIMRYNAATKTESVFVNSSVLVSI